MTTRDLLPATGTAADAPPAGATLTSWLTRSELSRRKFLGVAAGSLVLAVTLDERILAASLPPTGDAPVGAAIGGFVTISPDGTVTVLYGGAEMGQGTSTGLAQVVAEELGAAWSDVTVQAAPWGSCWTTGGSSGIRNYTARMRTAGAQAREMLKAAAADAWGMATTDGLTAVNSTITDGVRSLSFASLAAAAAVKTPPASPPLLRPGTYVGKSVKRLDIPAKTNGTARYGLDVRIPGMLYAIVRNSPVLGGTLKATPSRPAGALAVVNLGNACAVVASNTWAAIMAGKQLSASWLNPADATSNSSATIRSTAQTLLTSGTAVVAEGDPAAAAAAIGATPTLDQTYYVPYLAHVPMEVPNATVAPTYSATGVLTALDIWLGTQAPKSVQAAIVALGTTLVPAGTVITVHPTLLGGGFGRKIETDYAVQAVKTALALKRAVKLTWAREEDVSHDQYRPFGLARVRARLDPTTKLVTAWSNRIVSPSIAFQRGRLPASGIDSSAVECATTDTAVPYVAAAPTRAVEYVRHTSSLWVGYWRSVGASINVFVVESAMDELAKAAGMDEYRFRRAHLQARIAAGDPNAARFLAVLDAAATLGGWDTPLPAGRQRGISIATCFKSIVAEVVELSVPVAGTIQVHKVAVALDGGNYVNPDAVVAQLQGGVAYALSATLWDQVTFTSGKADQQNFSRYRMLRGREMPVVTTQLIVSNADPTGGVGELAVPGIASAVVSAYAKLTGTRVRSLPVFPGATMGG